MGESFRYDVFISHSSQDKPVVRQLAERLKGDGLRVWFDEWEIKAGDMISLKIEEGLEQSRTLILVMSVNAFASEWVTLERHTALFRDPTNAQRRFIPLRLDDGEIKDILRHFAYVDWRHKSDEQYVRLLAGCQPVAGATQPPSDLPENIKDLLKNGTEAFEGGRFEEARNAWETVLRLADAGGHIATKIRAKTNLAIILWHWDRKPEASKALLEACLQELRDTTFDRERANVLFQLGTVVGVLGDSDQAVSVLRQTLDLDRKLGRKLNEANTLVQLAWEIGHCGRSRETLDLNRQAFDCFMQVYQGDDAKKREDAIRGIAECYFQTAMVHKRDGKVEEAESALMSSLGWQRKVPANHQLAKILRELAGCKFHQREIDKGADLLKEAAQIYESLGHHLERARCFDMMGRLLFTLGQRKQAEMYFTGAATVASKAKHDGETAEFLFKMGQMRLDDGKLEDARRLFEQARDAAGDRWEDRAQCLVALARLAEEEKEPEEGKLLLREAIESVKRGLPTVQVAPKRAALLGDIGSYHLKLGEYADALTYFQKAKEIFESISNLHGVAETLGVIAHLKGRLGRGNEEHETYIQLRKLVDGTEFHEVIAVADINLAEFEMQKGNLDEAKRILKSAEILCRKYQLPYLSDVILSLDRVESLLAAHQPPSISLNELIDELYDQLSICPQNKDGYLRYWAFARSKEVAGNLRGSLGLHLMIVEENLEAFQSLAIKLKSYVDWSFFAIPSRRTEQVQDIIPLSDEMCIFSGTPVLCVDKEEAEQGSTALEDGEPDFPDELHYQRLASGGTLPRYFVCGPEDNSGDESNLTIAGWSLMLPQPLHQLVFENDAERLKETKIFFMHYGRGGVEDELLCDLRFGKEFRFLPVYSGPLPHSERVQLVISSAIRLPVFSNSDADALSPQIGKVKQDLIQLLHCTEESAANVLRQVSSDVVDLLHSGSPLDFVNLQIYLLKWSGKLSEAIHPAIVVKNQANV
jgi:tetratricopeptide (TPR) repeat protein